MHVLVQLHNAEQLREEVRLEREKLGSKEARLAGLEAALEATRREMDRQAAEVAAAMQVGGQCCDACWGDEGFECSLTALRLLGFLAMRLLMSARFCRMFRHLVCTCKLFCKSASSSSPPVHCVTWVCLPAAGVEAARV